MKSQSSFGVVAGVSCRKDADDPNETPDMFLK
jgi:hypothetical protein